MDVSSGSIRKCFSIAGPASDARLLVCGSARAPRLLHRTKKSIHSYNHSYIYINLLYWLYHSLQVCPLLC
jgi:hypothetical protein